MKTNHAIWILGAFAAFVAHECRADLNGSDDFNDNSKDPARWGTDLTAGAGFLTETNARLQYMTTGIPTGFDLVARPWILNFGTFTQNWEVRIDVSVPPMALSATQFVGFGLAVVPGPDLSMASVNRFYMDLDQAGSNRRFHCGVAANTIETSLAERPTASTYAAVRIAFDANTRSLSACYDEDGPACGYSWTRLGSTNVPSEWNMSSSSVFSISVIGNSFFATVASADNVFGDNFRTSSGLTPALGISLAGGKAALAWSSNAPPCQLQMASTLTPPICWQVVTDAPGIVGTNFTVSVPVSSDEAFYRLSR